jgi:hypothetical protein
MNAIGLNCPIKRHRMTRWIKQQYLIICCVQAKHLTNKHRIGMKGWKKIFQTYGSKNQAEVVIFSSDKIDYTLKLEETKRVPSY